MSTRVDLFDMSEILEFKKQTINLIDDLKSVCANYGLGNDGNEFKIITQVFLYKFLNDKFIYEVKKIEPNLKNSSSFSEDLKNYDKEKFKIILMQLNEGTATFESNQLISYLFLKQNDSNFANLFDKTLLDIAKNNSAVFSVTTQGNEKIILFEAISKFVEDDRDDFCRSIINKISQFSFEKIFNQKFDFYADIFEYLIKDYNSNSGGKYAEYFTPHSVAKIMANCLVNSQVSNALCYDPSAGSGTLLMSLAHKIGENKCTIYSQDISQKSSNLLRLNFIINNLVHSIPNVVKGNTILKPSHLETTGNLKKFNFIVSNPPFKLDFSDYRDELDNKENKDRFFAGIPNIPKKKKESMAIYLLFIQHIIFSLTDSGKAAIVVPTGFLTGMGIEKKIKEKLIKNKILKGAISMPSNIFANTGSNVSILFIDKENNSKKDAILIDASKLGEKIKIDGNEKTILSDKEEEMIVSTFLNKKTIDEFSVKVSYEEIEENNFSFSAGQYFDVKLNYEEISKDEFNKKFLNYINELDRLHEDAEECNKIINANLKDLIND